MATATQTIFKTGLARAVKAATVHVQEEARDTHRFTTRTGRLEHSIDAAIFTAGRIPYGVVALNEKTARYARFIHSGTRPHIIAARRRQALRWRAGGGWRFAKRVRHPGTKADPFLYAALDNSRAAIDAIFERYTDKTLEEVARDIGRTSYSIGG